MSKNRDPSVEQKNKLREKVTVPNCFRFVRQKMHVKYETIQLEASISTLEILGDKIIKNWNFLKIVILKKKPCHCKSGALF